MLRNNLLICFFIGLVSSQLDDCALDCLLLLNNVISENQIETSGCKCTNTLITDPIISPATNETPPKLVTADQNTPTRQEKDVNDLNLYKSIQDFVIKNQ